LEHANVSALQFVRAAGVTCGDARDERVSRHRGLDDRDRIERLSLPREPDFPWVMFWGSRRAQESSP
jgi:hypothetical protein